MADRDPGAARPRHARRSRPAKPGRDRRGFAAPSPEAQSFIFASDGELPDRWFRGYYFAGPDYVYGDEGSRRYEAERQVVIGGGEDGCYAVMRREGREIVFGSDFSGFKKIWYYQSPGFWLVSDSVVRAAQALRERGVAVAPNTAQLARMSLNKAVFQQQCSLESIVKGLRLVPLGCELVVGPSGCSIRRLTADKPPADYGATLSAFTNVWLARFRTILAHPRMDVTADLSGGLDSRATCAMVHLARRQLGPDALVRIVIKSTLTPAWQLWRTDRDDRRVAEAVADALGVEMHPKSNVAMISSHAAMRAWFEYKVGAHDKVSFPGRAMSPYHAHVGGGGGESNRSFYADSLGVESFDEILRLAERGTNAAPDALGLRTEMLESIHAIQSISPPDFDPLILHYRHFRARFHVGRPQYDVSPRPLSSRHMLACAEAAGQRRLEMGQIHYDLLHALEPKLLDVPFDRDYKTPSIDVRRALTEVRIEDASSRGAIFTEPERDASPAPRPAGPEASTIQLLGAAFDMAKRSRFAEEFLGGATLAEAERTMAEALKRDGFGNRRNSKPIVAVLACSLFDMPEVAEAALGGDLMPTPIAARRRRGRLAQR